MTSNLKTFAYMAPTSLVTKLGKDLRAAGYDVERTKETLVARHDGEVIARALKMRTVWSIRANPAYVTAVDA